MILIVNASILLLLSFSVFSNAENNLPSFIHVCHRLDPNRNECLFAAVEEIRPYLVKGVPDYNIPSIEPLVMKDLISEEIGTMKITTSNVTAYGCSDYFVRGMEIDTDANTYTISVDLPKLRIEAHFRVDGKILLLPVKGDGNMQTNVTDCVSKTVLKFETFEKDAKKYLRFVSSELKVKVTGGRVELGNLFNNDKVLLGMINDVVNKNQDAFLVELLPAIERALAGKILEIANDVVQAFPYDQLFPE